MSDKELKNGVVIPNSSHEWDKHDKRKTQLKTRVMCHLHYAIYKNEYNKV